MEREEWLQRLDEELYDEMILRRIKRLAARGDDWVGRQQPAPVRGGHFETDHDVNEDNDGI